METTKNLLHLLYRIAAAVLIVLLAACLVVSCGGKKEEPAPEPEEETVEYKANSPLGIAETYIGKDVQELILAVGTLKGDPVIEATNDGGGYEGTYEFDGFTVYTYAKAEDAEAIVTEIVPDEDSEVYKESIKTDERDDGGK